MSLRDYLASNFVDKAKFSALAGITEKRLDDLIRIEAIPAATYVCDGTTISSAAFGTMAISEQLSGEYFRPECLRWVQIANQAGPGNEKATVESVLASELQAAFIQLELVAPDEQLSFKTRIDEYLPSFFNGTFGLCVADPSSGIGIARKEILQEILGALTENGANPEPAAISAADLITLIDDYAAAAMPFSPAEYGRSSRKRLVDDLRPRVTKA